MDYSSLQEALTTMETYNIWDHSVTCNPAEVPLSPLPQPIKAGRMQG